jgi:hypothetical protein
MLGRQAIEGAEDLVEDADNALWRRLQREGREVDDVGEEDGHLGMRLGDDARRVLEPLGDRPRQDVQQQAL